MQQLTVKASRESHIYIGGGLRNQAGKLMQDAGLHGKAAVVTDSRVAGLYLDEVLHSLQEAGFSTCSFVFPEGEASKNTETYAKLLSFLAKNELTRADSIVALGGGVTGDMAGFAAATYLRGVHLVQIPTTLLAAVDSSVGGKTAVDLPEGKNLAGCVYQPHLVLVDPETLHTLPREQIACGMAEVIKYGVLGDRALFDRVKTGKFDFESVIARCIEMKADFVEQDEQDEGIRQLLNLGHTVGHAVEKCSRFSIQHGQAVAIGMVVIARAAQKKGWSQENCVPELIEALKNNHLPTGCPFQAEELLQVMLSDKKRRGDSIHLIVPERIGKAYRKNVAVSDLMDILRAGLDANEQAGGYR